MKSDASPLIDFTIDPVAVAARVSMRSAARTTTRKEAPKKSARKKTRAKKERASQAPARTEGFDARPRLFEKAQMRAAAFSLALILLGSAPVMAQPTLPTCKEKPPVSPDKPAPPEARTLPGFVVRSRLRDHRSATIARRNRTARRRSYHEDRKRDRALEPKLARIPALRTGTIGGCRRQPHRGRPHRQAGWRSGERRRIDEPRLQGGGPGGARVRGRERRADAGDQRDDGHVPRAIWSAGSTCSRTRGSSRPTKTTRPSFGSSAACPTRSRSIPTRAASV